MSSNKLEYDSSLGGSVELGTHVPTYRYAASSLQEIKRLLDDVRHPTSTKLIFQTLPKHMRRRAMSHHPKRLPRKYRAIHRSQMAKAGKPQQTKRPSRKYRRKPSNLLKEYIRRQRKNVWLETHIWHAKRFHMVTRWGYRLPYASCDKMYRACYRASAQHCLLQDISFHACLQFEGTVDEIRAGFAKLSSAKCGLSVVAKTYLSGRREGSLELFRQDQYPTGALGKVTFMWKPLEAPENSVKKRTLWMWVHPSCYNAVLEEIIKVFELSSMKSVKVQLENDQETAQSLDEDDSENNTKDPSNNTKQKTSRKQQRRLQFMTRTFAFERIKRYTNSQGTLELNELKDTLNRFRLTGPLAQSVLAHAFKVKPLNKSEESKDWFQTQMRMQSKFREYHQAQMAFWKQCENLNSPSTLMSNMILALNIEDPRIHRPQKRTKAMPSSETLNTQLPDALIDPSVDLAQSFIWQSNIRDRVCEQMLTTQAFCDKRAKHVVVPGATSTFESQLQPVPVLLVQRPGSQQPNYKRLGYACGWDVIAPTGYGMSIWLALIMWGAKPGGLREFNSIARELGTEHFLPDTIGGQQDLSERYVELRAKYFRLPPNKRCNYRKFSIVSPFRAPFTELVRDWQPATPSVNAGTTTPSINSFYILRDRALLQQLQTCISKGHSDFPKELSPNCLIQLQLIMKSRGNPGDFALICLPTRADFKRNLKLIKRESHDPVYSEPLRPDPDEKKRKILRLEHKKLLKRMRNRRVREKRKQQQTATVKVHIRSAGTSQLVAEQLKRMCELWLPENFSDLPNSVRRQCSREVFGYITNCSFSFIEASVCSVGYVTVEGLRQLLDVCKAAHVRHAMCLVRGTNSHHYRFVTFKLNLQV